MSELEKIARELEAKVNELCEENKKLKEINAELLEALEMANRLLNSTIGLFKEWPESQVIESAIDKAKSL